MQPTAIDEVIAAARPGVERLNVDQFHRMIESGILREGEPIELIDGILVRKDNSDAEGDPRTHGPRHALWIQRLRKLEDALRTHNVHLRQQLPIFTSEDREPEPDVVVVRGSVDDFATAHPRATDCLLVIEVADSSLEYDRSVKTPVYAAAAIPIFVIVNIPERQIEVYQDVDYELAHYARHSIAPSGGQILLELQDGIRLDLVVDEFLP